MAHKHTQHTCCEPNCPKRRWCAGRCFEHAKALKLNSPELFDDIKAMSNEEQETAFYKTSHPPAPKWEFLGDEDTLARMCGGENHG